MIEAAGSDMFPIAAPDYVPDNQKWGHFDRSTIGIMNVRILASESISQPLI